MTTVCGIDPGQSGGLVRLSEQSGILAAHPMPDMHTLASWLEKWFVSHVFIEKAQSMPKQGITSAFNYGDHFGQLQGIVIALGIPFTLVPPRTWQKPMFLGTKADLPPKQRALTAAQRQFPGVSFLATERSSKPHEGMIDAALIALYGLRTLSA